MGAENVSVPITQILCKELTVRGSFRCALFEWIQLAENDPC